MKKLKLMTILGTRPEIIRLSATIKLCNKYFNHVTVHTGQNYDYTLNQVFYEDLGLPEPNYYLNCVGGHLGETMGNIIARSYELLKQEQPDGLLVLGDTNSTLCAIAAKRLKIPIFHMEAGNRCWDWNVSEMVNRKIVDHIADVNLPYTEHARRYLLAEGLDGKMIFVTGSPMRQVLDEHMTAILKSDIMSKLGLTKQKYLLLSAHREENIDIPQNFEALMNSVNAVAAQYDMPVLYSTHPRSANIIKQRGFVFDPRVRSVEPFGFLDYVNLQMNALCVLSDSGTLSEESAMLGFPGVLIRTSTERPEALDAGSVVLGGIKSGEVLQAVELAVGMHSNSEKVGVPADYQGGNVAEKVVRILQSYAGVVNRTVWNK